MSRRIAMTVAVAALAFTMGACTGVSPSVTASLAPSDSPSPTASTSASAAASQLETPNNVPPTSSDNLFALLPAPQPADYASQITCTGAIGASDPVAIVRLQAAVEGTGDVVLRDYADASSSRTACTFGLESIAQLIDARHVVIYGNGAMAVVDLPEVRYHWFQVPDRGSFLAVGPKLDQVLWMTYHTEGAGTDTIYLSTRAGNQVIATLPTPGRGRCGIPEMDSKVAAYTLSGSHLFVLNQPVPVMNSLVVVAGETTVLSVIPPSAGWPPGANPLMALWSPTSETLYYGQGGDIWKWTAASDPQLFLPHVAWVQPTISADGAHLAYSVLRSDGLAHDVYLVDLAHGGSPQRIGDGARKLPVFVNSTQLWFKSEGKNYGCAGAEAEKPLIYNIVDGSEAPSIIYQVLNVWPATSSNF